MKWISVLLSVFLVNGALATDSVRIYEPDNLVVNGSTSGIFSLYVDEPSGDATSESAPAKIYVPFDINKTNGIRGYYYLNTASNATPYSLFLYDSDTGNATPGTYVIKYPLSITTGTTAKYIYAAVKLPSTGNYKVVARTASTYVNITNYAVNFDLSPQKVCEVSAAETPNCSNFDVSGTVTEIPKSFYVYFFQSDNSTLINTSIAPSSYSGVYFQLMMSNRVYTSSELTLSLASLRRGDERVTGSFTNTVTMEDFKKAMAFVHSGAACAANSPLSSCTGSLSSDSVANSQSGEFTLSGLTNGTPVTISVVLIDKYGFASVVSNSSSATPTDIEDLLKKQNCFLLTAGFGEEHFVIDYFRNYRDTILSKSLPGKIFIKYYYQYAPKFALSIYNNSEIRGLIRVAAYALYGLFNYYYVLILLILVGYVVMLKMVNNKNKNYFLKN